ncbi:MAG: M20 family metallopeptidase, partial [Candidatus Nanohalobium sp.]
MQWKNYREISREDSEEVKKILKELISIPSISGDEDQVRDYLEELLREKNLDVEKVGGNLVARIDNGSSRALHFNAHMDTVEAEEEKWNTGPFNPREDDGKLYGLGASDLKGAIAALVKTAEILAGKDLDLDLFFEFVVNEEVDGAGSKRLMESYE